MICSAFERCSGLLVGLLLIVGIGLTTLFEHNDDNRFAKSGAKIGSQLQIRLPNQYAVRTGAVMQNNDVVEQSVTLTVATQKGVDMSFSSADLTLSIDDFSKRHLEPAMSTLAANIEADAFNMTKDVYNLTGTKGTNPSTLLPWLQAQAKLDQFLAPDGRERNVQVDSGTMATMVEGLKSLYQEDKAIAKQYLEGYISRAGGLNWFKNNLTVNLANGSGSNTDTPVVKSTTGWSSATPGQLILTSGTSSGTYKKGQVFTLDGVYAVHPETKQAYNFLKQFVVTADATLSGGEQTIYFAPSIIPAGSGVLYNPLQNVSAAPAVDGNCAITFWGDASTSYLNNLVYHKEAFAFVSADLEMPDSGWFARETHDGISMRIWRQGDIVNDKRLCRIDVLYGYQTIRPQLACRVAGNSTL